MTRPGKLTHIRISLCFISFIVLCAGVGTAQRRTEKSPLEWARLLVSGLQPDNTSYQHKQGFVKWKGEDGADEFESRTDCSGFLNVLLERSYGLTPDDFEQWLGKRRPLAVHYFDAIREQRNFRGISNERDIRPGDIIAIRYPPGTNENTGHIMLIASTPVPHRQSKPEVENTEQWEISVIDSSESGHGKTDTRHKPDATFGSGVGQGVLRLYTNRDGEIVGYTWSTFAVSDYYDQSTRELLIGRLQLSHRKT